MFMIQPYGTCIVIGILAAYYVLHIRSTLQSTMTHQLTLRMISSFLWAGLIGSRLFYYTEMHSIKWTPSSLLAINTGGVSSQGAVLGILLACIFFIYHYGIDAIKIIDRIASCAPLTQAIARIGCLVAGCCYGTYTTVVWAITYTKTTSLAPLNIPLHPTQLYSTLFLLCSFILLQITFVRLLKQPGLTTALYLFLSSFERFMVDFLRGDRILLTCTLTLSQCAALFCASVALITIAFCVWNKPMIYERISKN